jgi:hypothetical protein
MMGWMVWGSMPVRGKIFFSLPKFPDWFWGPPSFLFHVYHIVGVLTWGVDRGMKFIPQYPCRTELKNGWSYTSVSYIYIYISSMSWSVISVHLLSVTQEQ